MPRTINVSTEVFASIWSRREEGEETEDAILRRILECGAPTRPTIEATSIRAEIGVRDYRNNVNFPEGLEIFRNYKGQEYRAIASGGTWIRKDTGQRFATLNQLNSSIAAGAENVWNGNWKYRAENGAVRSIAELRR